MTRRVAVEKSNKEIIECDFLYTRTLSLAFRYRQLVCRRAKRGKSHWFRERERERIAARGGPIESSARFRVGAGKLSFIPHRAYARRREEEGTTRSVREPREARKVASLFINRNWLEAATMRAARMGPALDWSIDSSARASSAIILRVWLCGRDRREDLLIQLNNPPLMDVSARLWWLYYFSR